MTLADIHVNWLNWFHFLILVGGLLVIMIDSLIFRSPLLVVIKMFMSTFFPRTARLWNSLPIERSLLINNSFSVCFNLSVLLFPVTAYLLVAVQPCMEWISLKEIRIREKYTAKTYVTIIMSVATRYLKVYIEGRRSLKKNYFKNSFFFPDQWFSTSFRKLFSWIVFKLWLVLLIEK